MSAALIRKLIEVHALNPTPRGDEIVEFYVPFDDLLGNKRTEASLLEAMNTGTRAAILGPSGCGKSSLCEWVLGAPGDAFAATRVPVAVERDETVTDPQAFAQHVIRTVSKNAVDSALISKQQRDHILRGSGDRIVRPGRETTKKSGLGLPHWLLKGELANEVTSYMESIDQPRSTTSVVDALEYLANLIASHDLQPVFVIDDSDAWLTVEGVRDRSSIVNDFFGRVLRMMAELPCGLVVAVHNEYLGTVGFGQAEGFLERMIQVPRLPDPETAARLVERRIQTCDETATWASVFSGEAVGALFGYYAGAGQHSVRKLLQAAQSGLHLAAEGDADTVTEEMVDSAISEWS